MSAGGRPIDGARAVVGANLLADRLKPVFVLIDV